MDKRQNSGSYQALDDYIEEQMHRLNIPGVSLAVIEGDQIVYRSGYGRERPGGQAPSPLTPFFIGSLTKSFTALAAMQLVEAGQVELDTSVQRYLPWFRVADPQVSAQITVRHLLNQTSGLPYNFVLPDSDDRPEAAERQVRALSTLKITRPVGSQCEYSNTNFDILGLIVEAASGESYPDYIQNHIFDPLEMRHSYTSRAKAKPDGLARGHRHWFSFPFPAPDLPIPAGSLASGFLISCAEDMAHYLIAHLNGGRYGNGQILSSAGIDELHRGVKEYFMLGMSGGKYGMGWFDIDLGQTKTYSHSGNCPDFSAYMAIIPGQVKGVVMLLNADPYGLPPITEEVGMNLTAVLAGQQPAPARWDFIKWVMRLLPLIPLLQVIGVLTTLRRIGRWRADPALRPASKHLWGEHILLPLIPNLTLAGILVYLQSKGLMRFVRLYMPDLAWIAQVSGGFAGIWAVLRSILMLGNSRKPNLQRKKI